MVEILQETPVVPEVPTPETPAPEMPDVTKLTAEKDEAIGRAQRAEAKLKELQPPEVPKPEEPPPASQAPETLKELIDARDYSVLLHDGYSKPEIDYIESMMKAKNINLDDALKDEYIQGTVKQMRASSKTDEAIPTPSSHKGPPAVAGKEFKDMTEKERSEHFNGPAFMARKNQKGI